MAQDLDALYESLQKLLDPAARNRLLAKGLARGMIWRDGALPEAAPAFPPELSADLLDYGYGVLALALEIRDENQRRAVAERFDVSEAFRVASEAIEAVYRKGDPADTDAGHHLVVAAAALHLGGFAARSYSLLPPSVLRRNLSSAERALFHLLRRDLSALRRHVAAWLDDPEHTDDGAAARLADADVAFDAGDAAVLALTRAYHLAVGRFDSALHLGDATLADAALSALRSVASHAAEIGNVPLWWIVTLTAHLIGDLWDQSLHARLPVVGPPLPSGWAAIRRAFIDVLSSRDPPRVDLWPSQLEAAARMFDQSDDLVVGLPTSSGKTLIAELCVLRALADKRRVVYVTPLRALSAQVERALARTFGPLGASVTSLYGAIGQTTVDAASLAAADIVVATPEKLDFAVRQDPDVLNDVGLLVFDEGHMIGLGSREIRYEVLIQRLLRRADSGNRRIVCLSAMFNPSDELFADFGAWLRSDDPGSPIHVDWRPTRQQHATLEWSSSRAAASLRFLGGEAPFVPTFVKRRAPQRRRRRDFPADDKEFCVAAANEFAGRGQNVLLYSSQRAQVEPLVRAFCDAARHGYLGGVAAPEPAELRVALAIGREWLGEKHDSVVGLQLGVGTHHGTLPRPFQSAVEDLLHRRRLPVVVASPTLAQGVDLACGVLIFRSLERFDQQRKEMVPIKAAEFANVVGRAGRAYVDLDGISVLPIFKTGNAGAKQREVFEALLKQSRGLALQSGLAQLVWTIADVLGKRLGARGRFLEYVLNHREMWADSRVLQVDDVDDDDDLLDAALAAQIDDLDVALLSLVDPLDTPVDELATVLDNVLESSLWKRTMARHGLGVQNLERALLVSRAQWIWSTTTFEQRQACFAGGLGRDAGVYLYDQLDRLVDILVTFNAAAMTGDADGGGAAAVAFANAVSEVPFFAPRKPPDDWADALTQWVQGTAFSDIGTSQKRAAFIQNHVVFKLVWAAETVRAHAVRSAHARVLGLGDGPALTLTHGVPSISAALLCQAGFASRVGAVAATQKIGWNFFTMSDVGSWIVEHRDRMSQDDFWDSADQQLLWEHRATGSGGGFAAAWVNDTGVVSVSWDGDPCGFGERLRMLPLGGRRARVCRLDLTPLGVAELPWPAIGCSLRATGRTAGRISVAYFGPEHSRRV